MTLGVLVSSGNGPGECQQAVGHVLRRMAAEADRMGVTLDVAERPGAQGPTSAVVLVQGAAAARFVSAWTGVVLWRCPSALRPRHKRKNWFVEVFPLPNVPRVREIDAADVEMTAIRAGGPGGQHQNKTASAVRARWRDYAVVVRDERSQHQNRRLALARLQALVAADLAETEAARKGAAHAMHHQLQRGDPQRVFDGPRFVEVS